MAASKEAPKATKRRQRSMLGTYAKLHKRLGRAPTATELTDVGITRDACKHHFGGLARLAAAARVEYPQHFHDVELTHDAIEAKQTELEACIASYSRFVITTAVVGCQVDAKFLASIRNYCAKNDACLLVLVAADPAKAATPGGYGMIDKRLEHDNIVLGDVRLNDTLFISTIKMSAKQTDPTTGMERIGQRSGSFVFASPKQRLKMVATSNAGMPCALMTTGSITLPNYRTNRYMSERTAYIADYDHVIGAVIVEVESKTVFHFRQVQTARDGSFIDLAVQYAPTTTKAVRAAALILGDWHVGATDPTIVAALPGMCETLKPKRLVMHDIFDGASVNRHEAGDSIARAKTARNNQANLADELRAVATDLKWLTTLAETVVVVASNHDHFADRYISEGRYLLDPHNLYISLQLAIAMLDGKRAFPEGVKLMTEGSKQHLARVRFLDIDEDYKVAGVQLGAHGHLGSNGSKGSLAAMEKAYGNSITGHSHTPGILRGAWAAGTSTHLELSYNKGPSSWLQSSVVLYENGQRQLLNFINKKWRL